MIVYDEASRLKSGRVRPSPRPELMDRFQLVKTELGVLEVSAPHQKIVELSGTS